MMIMMMVKMMMIEASLINDGNSPKYLLALFPVAAPRRRHTPRDTHKWATPLPGKTRLIVLNFNQSIGTTFNNMFNVYSSFRTIEF